MTCPRSGHDAWATQSTVGVQLLHITGQIRAKQHSIWLGLFFASRPSFSRRGTRYAPGSQGYGGKMRASMSGSAGTDTLDHKRSVQRAVRLSAGRLHGPHARRSHGSGRQDLRRPQHDHRAQRAAGQGARAPQHGRRQGRQRQAARAAAVRRRRVEHRGRVGQRAGLGPRAAHHRSGARHRRGGQGRPDADDVARDRRPAADRRIPAHGQGREHDGGAARHVLVGSHARRARGRHAKASSAARRS